MASNYDKGFIIEHIPSERKRISCRDCNYYDSSDKSCIKTPRVFPESGYDSYKYCKCFELDRNADFYNEKAKKSSNKKIKTPTYSTVNMIATGHMPLRKVKASLEANAKTESNKDIISDKEFKEYALVITDDKLPKGINYKFLNIYLDDGKKKLIQIGIMENTVYLDNKLYPQLFIDEVKRIHKRK